jgi:hypothetical protein
MFVCITPWSHAHSLKENISSNLKSYSNKIEVRIRSNDRVDGEKLKSQLNLVIQTAAIHTSAGSTVLTYIDCR